ncbi:MAG: hypothetical protein IAF94_04570 [Pirellulaceae bacterium]|nr:hypothetical protein [Pirellulaceae bacterium]
MGQSRLHNRPWWNWLLGSDSITPTSATSPVFRRRIRTEHCSILRNKYRFGALGYETLEPLCMLTGGAIIQAL